MLQTDLVTHELVRQTDVPLGRIQELVELAVGVLEHGYDLEAQLCVLHLDLRLEHARDEVENFARLEQLLFGNKFVLLDQFQIKNVVDQAEQ